jgi:4-cresol dehydrogenase (hydroxylating)
MNIGLGGRMGPTSADVVLDLNELRAILQYDSVFGVLDVEPGVSFRDAHAFLRARQSRFFVPAIGGPADASLIGNLLQRGEGCGPGGDRLAALIELEAVTASGEVVTAGRGRADRPGPDLAGLFIQSQAGVVTRASFALMPLPVGVVEFVLHLGDGAALAPALAALREAHLRNILEPGAISLWNGAKLATKYGGSYDPNSWFASGAIHVASHARAEADWADLLACLHTAGAPSTAVSTRLRHPTDGLGALLGEPEEGSMATVRSGLREPGDPNGQPGFAWVCPSIPFDQRALEAIAIIRATSEEGCVYAHTALTSHSSRTLRGFVSLTWDRSDRSAEARAMRCHDTLLDRLVRAGFPPFRLGHLSRDWRPAFANDTDAVTDRVLASLGSSRAELPSTH